MSGYRCVNYYDLCRLCTASQGEKMNVLKIPGLQGKIEKGLSITVDEKDQLPKTICNTCIKQVESIVEFKDSCDQAQTLLASCLNSTKLRNGGQVYIKDGPPKKPIVEPPQMTTPTFTITATPQPVQQNVSSDFLSSIIQAVGIHSQEEAQEVQQPQYTLTIDGQTLKASPIQYKLTETTPTYIQPQQIADENSISQNYVNEFLKIKDKKRETPAQMTIDFTPAASAAIKKAQAEANKAKKPKINLVLSSPPKQQQIPITIPTPSTPNKVSLQQIFQSNKAVVPIVIKADGSIDTSNSSLLSQLAAAQQQQQQQQQQSEIKSPPQVQPQYNPQVAYVQFKIQPNADGQPTVQVAPTAMPQLQLSQSSFQGLNNMTLQQQIQQQIQQQVAQLTANHQFQSGQTTTMPQISISAPQQTQIIQQQPQQQVSVSSQVSSQDIADIDDHMDTSGMESEPEPPPPPPPVQVAVAVPAQRTKQVQKQQQPQQPQQQQQPPTQHVKIKTESHDSSPQTTDSIMATLQMQLITSVKHDGPDPPTNLTTCDVCKKVFKRKEHLMQHLKSHIGLRPFKCEEAGCNKAFSRKEHLMRHIVSHTGKKMFSCELCHKFFSRKDNLNKHRRTHPEVAGDNAAFACDFCDQKFTVKTAYNQHRLTHEQAESADDEMIKTTNPTKKIDPNKPKQPIKIKQEDDPMSHQQIATISVPSTINNATQLTANTQQLSQPIQIQMSSAGQGQPHILQLPLQSIVSSAQNQITYNQTTTQSTKTTYFKAVSSADGNTVYTIPSNLILQNPAFVTSTGELQVGSFKIEN